MTLSNTVPALQQRLPVNRMPTAQANRQRVATRSELLVIDGPNPTYRATGKAQARALIVKELQTIAVPGVSWDLAIESLRVRYQAGRLPPVVHAAIEQNIKAGRDFIGRSTLFTWLNRAKAGGKQALVPRHRGRVRKEGGWEGPALEHFSQPSKPSIGAVHKHLTEVDRFDVTYEQVRAYLNAVPAQVGRMSPARIGQNKYRLSQRTYIQRCTDNALPGDVYVADGYRADVYLAHPLTGKLWRPELTMIIDMRSRFPVGWSIDEHESAVAVQNAFASTFSRWQHVPPMLYVDNGSGYKNQFVNDETTGFFYRAGIVDIIYAIPGNPHGKGWVERFFHTLRDDFLKTWQPALYCGGDMADEVGQRVVREVKAGRLALPSVADFEFALTQWVLRYAARPHPEDATTTPGEMWAQLQPIKPSPDAFELKRRVAQRKVQRARVVQQGRTYSHEALHAFNGQQVLLEYDLLDNTIGIVRTLDGRWICDAHLVQSIHSVNASRLDEARKKSLSNALERLESKVAETRARAGLVLDADAVVDAWTVPTIDITQPESQPEPIRLFDL